VGDVVEIGESDAAADPDAMRAYQGAMVETDVAVNQALRGLDDLVAAYNGAGAEVGGRVDADGVAAVSAAVDSLTYLDGWVERVGQGFELVDAVGGPLAEQALDGFVGPADLAQAMEESYTFGGSDTDVGPFGAGGIRARVVTRSGGTQVVVVTVDHAPHEISAQEWLLVAEHLGLDPRDGLVDVMVHGLNTSGDDAQAAGEAQADIYDDAGVDGATVVVFDWDAGSNPTQFAHAQSNTGLSGESLGGLFDYLGVADPAAKVNVTAHSLGNDVVLQGLADADRMPETTDVDYIAIQPAVDADFAEQERYDGALDLVDTLAVTVNKDDSALGHYERWYADGDPALGDEVPAEALADLEAAGAPEDTTVHDHDEDHAALNPEHAAITRELVEARAAEDAAGPTP
jgi:esterase/lipase superfamily enzyme